MNEDHSPEAEQGHWPITDFTRFRRFLIMGSEKGFYTTGDVEPKVDGVESMKNLIREGKGQAVVQELINFSIHNRCAKTKPLLYALATCVKDPDVVDLETKRAAYKALESVCQIPTHLFQFIYYCQKIVRDHAQNKKKKVGWGRASRKAVSRWYNNKDPMTLALYVTKYIQRHTWSHQDLLRVVHIKPKNEPIAVVLQYAAKGFKKIEKSMEKDQASGDNGNAKKLADTDPNTKHEQREYLKRKREENNETGEGDMEPDIDEDADLMEIELKKVKTYLKAVHDLKHERDETKAAQLIIEHNLVHEHIPTWMQKSRIVYIALLEKMPMHALIRNLGKLTSLGLLKATDPDNRILSVVSRLKDDTLIQNARLHPFQMLLAYQTYKSGRGDVGKLKWEADGTIIDALKSAFYASFKNVQPSNKRFLLALDVSGSMNYGGVNGCTSVSPALASAAMVMLLKRTEPHVDNVICFTNHGLQRVDITNDMELDHILTEMNIVEQGSADATRAINHAEANALDVDVFVMFTDCNVMESTDNPAEALRRYRKAMKKPKAKLIVIAMKNNELSIADPNDGGMLDIAGFDASVPKLIYTFINDVFDDGSTTP